MREGSLAVFAFGSGKASVIEVRTPVPVCSLRGREGTVWKRGEREDFAGEERLPAADPAEKGELALGGKRDLYKERRRPPERDKYVRSLPAEKKKECAPVQREGPIGERRRRPRGPHSEVGVPLESTVRGFHFPREGKKGREKRGEGKGKCPEEDPVVAIPGDRRPKEKEGG